MQQPQLRTDLAGLENTPSAFELGKGKRTTVNSSIVAVEALTGQNSMGESDG